MSKYKTNKKSSDLEGIKALHEKRDILESKIKEYENRIDIAKKTGNITEKNRALDEIEYLRRELEYVNEDIKKNRKTISLRLGALLVAGTFALSVAKGIKNNTEDKTIMNATSDKASASFVETEENKTPIENSDDKDASSLVFENDLKRYKELRNKEEISSKEEKELKNIKTRILANPNEMTNYALKLVKEQIAQKNNIDDISRITVYYNSVIKTNYNEDTYKIIIDGKEVVSIVDTGWLKLSDEDKEVITIEIIEAIRKIGIAQENKGDSRAAYSAFKETVRLGKEKRDNSKQVEVIEEEER